jgi:hypothetical protein
METLVETRPLSRWPVVVGFIGGGLLAALPALVELVADDFIVLLPIALIMAFVVVRPLRGSTIHRVFVATLALAVASELLEQFAFPDEVPAWANAAPLVFFTVTGVALVLTAWERARA